MMHCRRHSDVIDSCVLRMQEEEDTDKPKIEDLDEDEEDEDKEKSKDKKKKKKIKEKYTEVLLCCVVLSSLLITSMC